MPRNTKWNVGVAVSPRVRPASSTRGAWPPRHYALCTAYKGSTFHGLAAKVRQAEGWTYSEFDAHHDVVRTHPQLVADLIAGLADHVGVAKPYAMTP